jgi:hypothetical protein
MKKLAVLGFVEILIIVLLYQIYSNSTTQQAEVSFNKVTFNDNNKVLNRIGLTYMDTVVLAGLKELGIKNTNVLIKELNTQIIENTDTQAYIEQVGPIYLIWIRKVSKKECILILSHELIHLKQYSDKRVEINEVERYIRWENTKILEQEIPEYSERPWELEAFAKQGVLKNKIENILYN